MIGRSSSQRPITRTADVASSDKRTRLTARRRAGWIAAYMLALLWTFPLLALADKPGSRTAGTVFAAGLGFVAISALVLQVVLPSRTAAFTAPFGIDRLVRVHRGMGYAVVALALLHVVVLFADDPARLRLLDPIHAPTRARAGMLATLALVALVATSAWRRRFRLDYERWRGLHLVLASLSVTAAFVHVILVGEYAATSAIRWALVGFVTVAVAALFYLRVGRPFAATRRPYVLTDVQLERNGASTLTLEASGHAGTPFRPGQFAWIKVMDRPYAVAEHPFSYASSALNPGRLSFTIGRSGDFTSGVAMLPLGTRVLIDGPHGSWRPALPDAGYVLLAAGMGITPVLSMLRTWKDARNPRAVQLIFANRRWQQVPFREELERLRRDLDLDLVHVLSEPEDGWKGERGYVDARLLRRVWPPDAYARNFFVCGPPPMVAAVESALCQLRVPSEHVHLERFASA